MTSTDEMPRAQFLAEHPKEAKLQATQIGQITKLIAEFRKNGRKTWDEFVKLAEKGRQIGLIVLELEESLPGRRLTEDFWRQMPELFRDSTGQKVTREMLQWFAKIAKQNTEPFEDVIAVRQNMQLLLMASGENDFQLEGHRAPQVEHAPPNPLSLLKEQFNVSRLQDAYDRLRADENYCPNGKFRSDLRDTLRVELAPAIKLIDQLRTELGL